MKNPSYNKKRSYGFFASLRMTNKRTQVLKIIDTFNGRSSIVD
jgi:hypothetical protein